jgi:hypothetical protein
MKSGPNAMAKETEANHVVCCVIWFVVWLKYGDRKGVSQMHALEDLVYASNARQQANSSISNILSALKDT